MNQQKMKFSTTAFIALMLVALMFTQNVEAATNTPKLQEIWIKVLYTDAITALRNHELDIVAPDTMGSWPEIERALDEGFKYISEISIKFSSFTFNCRDYNPKTGESLWPLNDTAFRQALAWLYGHDSKEEMLSGVYGGPTNEPLDSIIPPAYPTYYNPDVMVYNHNPVVANATLYDAGYRVTGGKLVGPNSIPVRDEIVIKTFSRAQFPTATPEAENVAAVWNDFFDNFLGVTNVNFVIMELDQMSALYPDVWTDKNFEVGHTIFQPAISFIVNWFASWMRYVPYGNAAGVNDGYVDYLCATILYNSNETERIQAAHQLQLLDSTNVWYIPTWVDYAFSVIDPGLEGWVSALGDGFENTWTWRTLHWKDPAKTSVTRWMANLPSNNYHPGYESLSWIWGNEVQLFEPILEVDPWNQLSRVPWVAESWATELITTPWGNAGQKISFKIRDGIYWHDSGAYNDTNSNGQWDPEEPKYEYPVTAEDVAFTINMIRTFYFPSYYSIYLPTAVYDQKVVDSDTVEIYVNSTDQWIIHNIADFGLIFPKHIWQNVGWHNIQTFNPGATLYKDWTGLNPPDWTKTAPFDPAHGGMKALVGCGPFVFDFFDSPTAIGHLIRNPNYWCDWTREDINLDLKVNIVDISTAAKAFGTKRGDARWSTPSDINGDGSINIVDLTFVAKQFGWKGIPST